MDHIAFMQKAWGLTEKIVTGQKTIESRWYNVRYSPWGKISPGDMIYFKDGGEPIRLRAQVAKIHSYTNLVPQQVRALLEEYGEACGIEPGQIMDYHARFQDKRYAIFLFLKNPQRIAPFDINKAGFGKKASWICVENVGLLRVYAAILEREVGSKDGYVEAQGRLEELLETSEEMHRVWHEDV